MRWRERELARRTLPLVGRSSKSSWRSRTCVHASEAVALTITTSCPGGTARPASNWGAPRGLGLLV